MAANLGWELLTTITAQHYLRDIDRELQAIRAEIQEIREFLEQDREGKLVGSIKYVQQVAPLLMQPLRQDELARVQNQLECIERESGQICEAYQPRITSGFDKLKDFENTDPRGWVSLKSTFLDDLAAAGRRFERDFRAAQVTLLTRTVALQALAPRATPTLAAARLESLCEEASELAITGNSAVAAITSALENARRTITDHPVNRTRHLLPYLPSALAQRRLQMQRTTLDGLITELEHRRIGVRRQAEALSTALERIHRTLAELREPLVIEAETSESGEIVALRRPEAPEAPPRVSHRQPT
jgi:hypothetical protein